MLKGGENDNFLVKRKKKFTIEIRLLFLSTSTEALATIHCTFIEDKGI